MKKMLTKDDEKNRYLKIRELVEDVPNDMELGGKVRALFNVKVDTAGFPIETVNSYFSTDLKDDMNV
jgi:hypothetical protein|tara:strand:- start:76 stop:276 length:201 start_codon:yes stop_codon:yes gene_type:complete